MGLRKGLFAVVGALVIAAASVIVVAPTGSAGSSRVSPGPVLVSNGGELLITAHNPTGRTVVFNTVLRGTNTDHWDRTSDSDSMPPRSSAAQMFTCSAPSGCFAVPVMSPASLLLSGTYDSVEAGYVVAFDAGSFKAF